MRTILIYLLMVFLCISLVDAAPYSTSWFTTGNSFSLDDEIYTLFLTGDKDSVRILINSETNSSNSDILKLNDCYETNSEKICFTEIDTSENKLRVKAEFNHINNEVYFNRSIEKLNPFIFDSTKITYRLSSEGTVKNISFKLFIPKEITIKKSTGCKIVSNSTGSFVEYSSSVVSDDSFSFELESEYPLSFDLAGSWSFISFDKLKNSSISPETISFKLPYEYTVSKYFDNESDVFTLNLSFYNSADDEIEFKDVEILVPKTFNIDEDLLTSSDILGYNYFLISFDLDPKEMKNFSYSITAPLHKNETLFILPRFNFNSNLFTEKYLDSFSWDFEFNDVEIEVSEINCSNFLLNLTYDSDETLLSGSELDFKAYIKNEASVVLENVTISLFEDGRRIGFRTFDFILKNEKYLFSRIYKIIPDLKENKTIKYTLKADYFCGGKSYSKKTEKNISVYPFPKIKLSSNLPGIIKFGEKVKVVTTISNEDKSYINSVMIRENIPPELNVDGVVERSLSLKEEGKVDVLTYYVEPKQNKDSEVSIITEAILFQGNHSNLVTNEEILTIQKENVSYFDLSEKIPSLFVSEPNDLKFEITNKYKESITNFKAFIEPNQDYYISDSLVKYPIIYPNQTIFVTFSLIPRIDDLNFSLYIKSDFEDSINIFNAKPEKTRMGLILPSYDIYEYKYLNGTYESVLRFFNYTNGSLNVKINSNKYDLDNTGVTNITIFDRSENITVFSTILGIDYILLPNRVQYLEKKGLDYSDNLFDNVTRNSDIGLLGNNLYNKQNLSSNDEEAENHEENKDKINTENGSLTNITLGNPDSRKSSSESKSFIKNIFSSIKSFLSKIKLLR